jgi:hypothetical protein
MTSSLNSETIAKLKDNAADEWQWFLARGRVCPKGWVLRLEDDEHQNDLKEYGFGQNTSRLQRSGGGASYEPS